MNRYPLWPFSSFWFRTQHAHPTYDPADAAPGPRELNPYERLIVRFMFAELKITVAFACAVPIAAGYVAALVWPFWGLVGAAALGVLVPSMLFAWFSWRGAYEKRP